MAVNKSMSYIEGIFRQTISYPVVSIIKKLRYQKKLETLQ